MKNTIRQIVREYLIKNSYRGDLLNESVIPKDVEDAIDFYTDTKVGIELDTKFKGRFNKSIFLRAFEARTDIIKLNAYKVSLRRRAYINPAEYAIKTWSNLLGMRHYKYIEGDIIEDIEFKKDATLRAEKLYRIYISTK